MQKQGGFIIGQSHPGPACSKEICHNSISRTQKQIVEFGHKTNDLVKQFQIFSDNPTKLNNRGELNGSWPIAYDNNT